MAYRLLALDLDGTLFRHDKSIDARDVAAIHELAASGVIVTIVTGRLLTGAVGAARTCSIEGAIACVEGSHLVELASRRTLLHHAMAPDLVALLRATFAANGLATFVFDAETIHHDHRGASYAAYVGTWSPELRLVEEEVVWRAAPLATVAIGPPEPVAAALADLARVPGLYTVSFDLHHHPGMRAILVRAEGPTKGTALTELCRNAGLTLADAVAVGDWVNDIPMFQVAGRSFAMGGAPDPVVAVATDVLATHVGEGGGIAEAIRRAWG
ncbi:MAG: HAD hydrolase family protein [Deltaproteobacteria bacterium]|nr:HAD hydrolase family protein [Deltaproteobacteria bacterium]